MLSLFRLSGVFSVVSTWILVVYPAFRICKNPKKYTISKLAKDKRVGPYVQLGLILGSVFQFFFWIYLLNRFNIELLSFISLGYISAIFASFLLAFIPEHHHLRVHRGLTVYYFSVMPIIFVGLFLLTNNLVLFYLSCIGTIAYFIGTLWIMKKYWLCMIIEEWAFVLLSLAIVILTII
jgi:hypothetical protein